ncbi:hypothetical protein RLOatenuis_0740 [Rickettsiales bacterium]|nr:hypothetical protein RLOatenuis_0740 [Rickettsiales bacterium]
MPNDAEKTLSLCKQLQKIHSNIALCLIALLGNSDKCLFVGLGYRGKKIKKKNGKRQKAKTTLLGIPILKLSAEEAKKLSPLLDPCWGHLRGYQDIRPLYKSANEEEYKRQKLELDKLWLNIGERLLKIKEEEVSMDEKLTKEDKTKKLSAFTAQCQYVIERELERKWQRKKPSELYVTNDEGIAFAKISTQKLSEPATLHRHKPKCVHGASFYESKSYHEKICLRNTKAEEEYKVLVEYESESNEEVSTIELFKNNESILILGNRYNKEGKPPVSLQEELSNEPEKAKIISETLKAATHKALVLIRTELRKLLNQKKLEQQPKNGQKINAIQEALESVNKIKKDFAEIKRHTPEEFGRPVDKIQEAAAQETAAGTTPPPISTQLEEAKGTGSQRRRACQSRKHT